MTKHLIIIDEGHCLLPKGCITNGRIMREVQLPFQSILMVSVKMARHMNELLTRHLVDQELVERILIARHPIHDAFQPRLRHANLQCLGSHEHLSQRATRPKIERI